MFEVVRAFRDAKNNDHYYAVGDTYPVSGYKPTKARIEELVKGTNKNGKVYLKEVKEQKDENPSADAPQTAAPEDTDAPQTPDNGSEE